MNDKDQYGKVETPISLIKEIYGLLSPPSGLRVYEPGVGTNLFRKNYPTSCYYSGCEIKPTIPLEDIFIGDFFEHELEEYDLILGNPPFRVETNSSSTSPIPTKPSQKTIWMDIVKRCWKHLIIGGKLAMILPCIWLKPDKAGIYTLFTTNHIEYIRTFDSTESNKLFKYKGQTPSCYVIVRKLAEPISMNTFKLWDNGFIDFTLKLGYCIPTKNAKLLSSLIINDPLKVIKIASVVPKGSIVELINDKPDTYPIIVGTSNKTTFNGLYHTSPGLYQGIPKIILAHKRLPIPYLDLEGKYGVHGRDKYVIIGSDDELQMIYKFLNTELAQKIIKSFTIRMNYYEKYIFDYVPGIKDLQGYK
jgi:hypothetical protein